MEIMNWGWPQVLLAVWWSAWFFVALGANLMKGTVQSWGEFLGHQGAVITLALILYFGGFWA